ncbi:MAG: helix-turn-helix transcriptional regulator [Longibaculum muris]|uniref:DNA-binding XRE family transcriptional regulator n=1 Tax=Longibaculum muris TaxID=1796628 RepID=A0A4R3Z623_9FIRM|nr:helix-turn-helix transcriptional regulator [Longibaculum muris]KXU42438.1 DNA-binding helix-turn-helix protein [Candidatus Stoquefichus sp. KLE1796]MBS5370205.1 helix-turn-helix transcriptional regulator [Coprobacillus cateniformis]MCR1888762.1 helix-turn-helix domain-containing protein [Longibaculum muris]MED9811236.1 helix-turn-helix transcriptional regulator [Longibaculum muris]TCV99607.1 DNA-binding XRE family transcriptional regulator [Longibaculum muris]
MSIGKRLLSLRQQKGMSQEELANQLHVSRQTISKWESDLSLPDMKTMLDISDFFQISITELLGIEEDNHNHSIEQIYDQTKIVLDNLQKENQRRKTRDYIIIGVCVACMVLVSSLYFLNLIKPRTVSSKTTVHEYVINNSSSEEERYIDLSHSSFETKSYDLENLNVTVDYQCALKVYHNQKVELVFVDENHQNYIYPMIFQNEKYVYQGTIPLLNYLETKITIEEENQEKRVEYIESNQKLLNQVLQYKIYLCFENLDDNHIGVKRLRYYPQENNSSEMEKAKGELPGKLYVQVVSGNEQLANTNIPLNKASYIPLKRRLENKEVVTIKSKVVIGEKTYYETEFEKQIMYGSFSSIILPNEMLMLHKEAEINKSRTDRPTIPFLTVS